MRGIRQINRTMRVVGFCFLAVGCQSYLSPPNPVVSGWVPDSSGINSAAFIDSGKVPASSMDNVAGALKISEEDIPAIRQESPFDRFRARQKALSLATPINPVPTEAGIQIGLKAPIPEQPSETNVLPHSGLPMQTTLSLPHPGVENLQIPGVSSIIISGPNGVVFPVQDRTTPSVRGGILDPAPSDPPVELSHRLSVLENEQKILVSRMKQLEEDLESREKRFDTSIMEADLASKDIVKARAEVENLRKELATDREKLKQSFKEDLETLRLIVVALRKISPPVPVEP